MEHFTKAYPLRMYTIHQVHPVFTHAAIESIGRRGIYDVSCDFESYSYS